jgi:hypothetical protein
MTALDRMVSTFHTVGYFCALQGMSDTTIQAPLQPERFHLPDIIACMEKIRACRVQGTYIDEQLKAFWVSGKRGRVQ